MSYLEEVESGSIRLQDNPNFFLQLHVPPPNGLLEGLHTGWNYVIVYVVSGRFVTSDTPVVAHSLRTSRHDVSPAVGLSGADE